MGTANEWLKAIVWGGLWGAFMAWFEWKALDQASLPRRERVLRLALWAPTGLWFGVVTTFGWQRAFHSPLLFVTVGWLASMVLMAKVLRRKPSIDMADRSS